MLSELYIDREAIGGCEYDLINPFIMDLIRSYQGRIQWPIIVKKDSEDRFIYVGIEKKGVES